MFVTKITLRGLSQICGTLSIHVALLITIFMYFPAGTDAATEEGILMNDAQLRKLMIYSHLMLILSCLCVSLNLFEGIGQQVLCFSSVLLYMLMITQVVRDIYD